MKEPPRANGSKANPQNAVSNSVRFAFGASRRTVNAGNANASSTYERVMSGINRRSESMMLSALEREDFRSAQRIRRARRNMINNLNGR